MKTKTLLAVVALASFGTIYLSYLSDSLNSSASTKLLPPTSVASTPANLVSTDGAQVKTKSKKWRAQKNTFTIDPSITQTIEAREGTYLQFESTQFVYEDGTPVTEPFTLTVEEYYEKAAMIKAKLSTTSDGRLLETGGMVHMEAFNAKGKIKIAEGSQYTIGFPKNGTDKDDFQLFYGDWREDDLINWRLADETIDTSAELVEEALSNEVVSMSYIEDLQTGEKWEIRSVEKRSPAAIEPVASGSISGARMINPGEVCFIQINKSELRRDEKISKMDYFNWQLTNGQTMSQWFAGGFNPSADMVNDFCEDKLRTEITFQVDKDGQFKSHYVSHSSTTEYDRVISEFLETMPPLDLKVLMPKYVVDHACILSFGSAISKRQNDFTAQFKKDFGADSTATVGDVKAGLMDYYIMSSTELGWINCDRFVGSEDALVNFSIDYAQPNCFVALLFDEYESILRGQYTGGQFVFNRIAKNQPVHVLLIDYSTATPRMTYIESNTNRGSAAVKTPEPFHLHDLDAILQKPKPDRPKIIS